MRRIAVAWLLLCATGSAPAEPAASPKAPGEGSQPAAMVSDEPIRLDEVRQLIREATRQRPLAPGAREILEAEALAQLVDRRLVEAALRRQGQWVSDARVEEAIDSLKADIERQKLDFDEYLRQRELSLPSLGRLIAWRMAWSAYIDRQATDEALKQLFEAERRQFDGSQVRASQILWRLAPTAGSEQREQVLSQARNVRQQIAAGQITFAEAAQKYSQAPSAAQGGDIGFFPRHGVMDESFSRAAFALQPGDISPPLVSPFGVHLIQCTELRPGDKTASQVRKELRVALAQRLFKELSEAERPGARIEFTGAAAYFKPGTRELAPR